MNDWRQYVRAHLPPLDISPEREIEIVEELAAQLEAVYEAALAQGATPAEARERAEREIVDWRAFAATIAPERPARPTVNPLSIAHDVRHGMKALSRAKAFCGVAAATLGLGIGAATSVFSVARAWWLAPLPYHAPQEIAFVWATNLEVGQPRDVMSGPTFLDLQRRTTTFSGLAAFAGTDLTIRDGDGADLVPRLEVTPEFFDVLGLTPALGRGFRSDDAVTGDGRVALLGHGFWQQRFGGDHSILGRPLSALGHPHIVVGVLPERLGLLGSTEVVTLLSPEDLASEPRTHYYYWAIGRLKAGVSAEAAEVELNGIMRAIADDFPAARGWQVRVDPLERLAAEPVRPALLILLAAVGLVVLIATLNVANLVLTRLLERQHEMDIRAALGARRIRLIRQIGIEAALLSLAAGTLGVAIAGGFVRAMPRILPSSVAVKGSAATLPLSAPHMDLAVFGFALLMTAATLVVLAAVQASGLRRDIGAMRLGERTGTATPSTKRGRALLIAGQTAFAAILLVAAGLLLHTVLRLMQTDPGFRSAGVVTMIIGRVHELDAPARARYYAEVLRRVLATPGVTAAGLNDYVPLTNEDDYEGFSIEGRPPPAPGQGYREEWRRISPGYFSTMGIRLLGGRGFTVFDTEASPSVVIVNESMARKYWPGEDPVGRRIRVHASGYGWSEVVGVAADILEVGLDSDPKPMFFVPYHRAPRPVMGLFVRTTEPPLEMGGSVRRAVSAVDPTRPISDVSTLDAIVSGSYLVKQMMLWIAAGLAFLAALLTAAGIYAVVHMTVAQRTREIGVRIALGAGARTVRWLVVRQGLLPSAMGLLLGLALARLGTRFLESELYGVSPSDPVTYALVAAAVGLTAALASLVPARRATRIDPVRALRCD
jgi:predicted permease